MNVSQRQFWGLRKLLKKYDWDRYTAAEWLIESGERILDIGCGEGYMLRKLSGKFKELYGLDTSPSRLQEAEAKTKEFYPSEGSKFRFIEGDADDPLPFQDNFSLVKEMYRVLKLSGYVVEEVPNIAYFKNRLALLLGGLPVTSSPFNWQEVGWDGGHIHYFTMKKFCWLFESQGFRIEKRTGSGFLAKFRNWWPSLLT
ncbi:methyltransferase domain-containing protein, partial [bacterium]|nr:methyltransferase domain-containing protein [bacterium]